MTFSKRQAHRLAFCILENVVNKSLFRMDILFCNAGVRSLPVRLHKMTIEDWDASLNLSLRGTFLCMRAVIPIMLKQKRGSIISTASVAGLIAGHERRAVKNMACSGGAATGGVISLTRHAAVQYAKDGIRVNAIAPGSHNTEPLSPPPELMKLSWEKIARFTPMGRIGRPSEIKGLAVYLASDASSYVTGQTFVQDGGFIA